MLDDSKELKNNTSLLSKSYLSTQDVLLKPKQGVVATRKDVDLNSTFLYSSPMDTVIHDKMIMALLKENQAAVSCRFFSKEERFTELQKYHANPNYWFSVGTSRNDFDNLRDFTEQNNIKQINISVDVAHGDTLNLNKLYKLYSAQKWCRNLMSGTVATPESAANVFDSGCTHIRVGIGPGSACSTRIITGFGVPNLSAIFQIWNHFYRDDFYDCKPVIIADGGIKTSSDIAKYLCAGADGVMVGSLLSKAIESPGWKSSIFRKIVNVLSFNTIYKNKIVFKRYRGQASEAFQKERRGSVSGTPEGVQGPEQYPEYTFSELFDSLCHGLRSAISYSGQKNIQGLNPNNVEIIKITQNGLQESKPNILD